MEPVRVVERKSETEKVNERLDVTVPSRSGTSRTHNTNFSCVIVVS